MKINLKINTVISFVLLIIPAITLAASNPCDRNCVLKLMKENPSIGRFTSNSWISACPTGVAGLSQGCLINGASAAESPIGPIINIMFNILNTKPTSVESSVYIRRFPPGYSFATTDHKHVRLDATNLPTTTLVFCSPSYAENGVLINDGGITNDKTQFGDGISQVGDGYHVIGGQENTNWTALHTTPGSSPTAFPLGIALYTVCVGTDTITGAPVSLSGFSAS